ncbi:YdcF family protein [Bacillus testis]|uniref:YdcF family protein n=1 Tax=Bacillus testis TaxID=1622072 RepID=UPI00067F3B01|nr:YdcF family protein [Bacillus testis]
MKHKRFAKIVKVVFPLLLVAGMAYVAMLHWHIHSAGKDKVPEHLDYVIILGTKVNGETPSLALRERIQTAAHYLRDNPSTIAIASGGQGPNEGISEAQAIKTALIEEGIEENRIRMESKSTTTKENIAYSKKLIPDIEQKSGAIVTNQFHLYRALLIANDHHLDSYGIAAKTPAAVKVKLYIREYLATTKYYLLKLAS